MKPDLPAGVSYYAAENGVQTAKPRLLLLTQVLPFPADAGPKIKTLNLIKFLADQFAITLVSFVRADNTSSDVRQLLAFCTEVYTVPMVRSRNRDLSAFGQSLWQRQPFLMARDRSAVMCKLLSELSARRDFAVVQADQLNMAQFALEIPAPLRVLDEHNAVWTITERLRRQENNPLKWLVLKLETGKLRRYEQTVCQKFDRVLAVSAADADALGVPCEIAPIGLDVENTVPLERKSGSLNLVSLGTMFYPPNAEGALWFGYEVFPRILQVQPNATFTIVGARPPAALHKLAQKVPNVRMLGYVPDVRPILEDSAGLVVPLLSGGGMRVKILEAFALGLPVISTSVGAEGIALEHGQSGLLANDAAGFARACLDLLESEELGNKLVTNGRQLALNNYDYRRTYQLLREVYGRVARTGETAVL